MSNRWFILAVLFLARSAMAFQFQSVAALSPLILDSLLLSIVDVGLLIGLYLGPGVVVAILGGSVAAVFGDKRVVAASLLLMVVGGAMMAMAETFEALIIGRVLAGIGGVVVNVLMTKMVVDWFGGRDLATAMAIFLSSWPMGIGLALVVLPWLASMGGLTLAWGGVVGVASVALVAFALAYRTPEGAAAHGRIAFVGLPWGSLILAASIWAFYNAALAMVFGFGPIILVERGLPVAQASAATSLFMFAVVLAMPIGGKIADALGRSDWIITGTLVAGIVLLPLLPHLTGANVWVAFALAGFVIGLSPGAIVGLTAQILPPEARAFGMGVYWSIYYAVMMAAPPLAGAFADQAGTAGIAFWLGAGMMAICVAAYLAFRARLARAD